MPLQSSKKCKFFQKLLHIKAIKSLNLKMFFSFFPTSIKLIHLVLGISLSKYKQKKSLKGNEKVMKIYRYDKGKNIWIFCLLYKHCWVF